MRCNRALSSAAARTRWTIINATTLQAPGLREWLALLGLVVMWGSRFYANEIALTSFAPLDIVFLSLLVAALALWLVLRATGLGLPRDGKSWVYFHVLALLGNGLPYFLEAWSQVTIDSGLVGILMSVTPLSVLALAHWLLPDERADGLRTTGFLLGLVGVVLLIGPDALRALGGDIMRVIAQLAVLGAAVSYGLAAVVTRLAPAHPPRVIAAGVLIAAAVQLTPIWLIGSDPTVVTRAAWPAVAAVLGIGLICVALAALIFFYLIAHSGAAFQSLANYLMPVWAVLIGYLLLDEQLPANAFVALALILVSLWLTHRQSHRTLDDGSD